MKYMDYLVQGFDISYLRWDAKDIKLFRHRIAIELKNGKVGESPNSLCVRGCKMLSLLGIFIFGSCSLLELVVLI